MYIYAYRSVFETQGQTYSTSDLDRFQTREGLLHQQPISIYGFNQTATCTSGNCIEGNADVQYIMGIAQNVTTIYWYIPGGSYATDPFVTYIVDIDSQPFVSQSNSISWIGDEYVSVL